MHPTATERTLRTIQRHVRLRPRHPRDPDQVDRQLWERFRELVYGVKRWPLLLHGPAGSGKTSASLALCDVAATAMITTVDELCSRVMRTADEGEPWDWIAGKDLAVLDELGCRTRVGDLHYSAVKGFADAREHRPAIYISNLTPRELRSLYDERIYSRIACGTWFHVDGPDRRTQ